MAIFGKGSDVHGNVRSKAKRRDEWLQNKRGTNQSRKLKPPKCLFNFLKDYCYRSSLHGLRYIVEPGAHWLERLVWAFLFSSSVICAIWVILKLAARYQTGETSTVVESTNYPISKLPFPSVTLCPSSRVNWQKALEMEKDIVPENDPEAVQTYRDLITTFATITFGDFDSLEFLKNRSLEAFDNTILGIAPTCSELLLSCWWRNTNRNCCELFDPQRTEYGFCYSFNSETADYEKEIYLKDRRPRRTNTVGDWSGIRLTVNLNKSNQPPEADKAIGVTVFVGHPYSWASSGRDTGLGKLANIAVRCGSNYATERVFKLDRDKLPCTLEGLETYNPDFCMTMCRRNYVIEFCGCNPTFLMPRGLTRDCNLNDLICLANHNDFLNNYILRGNPYFPENDSGMNCTCPSQCESYDYTYQATETGLRDAISKNTILIDVHFESNNMMRYRMDVIYTQLDLLVSFGGVVGLFVGGSILSLMELLYHVVVGICSNIFDRPKKGQVTVEESKYVRNNIKPKRPGPLECKVFPLMDYPPDPRKKLRRY